MIRRLALFIVFIHLGATAFSAEPRIEVPAPSAVTLSVYDTGLTSVTELRRLMLQEGEQTLVFTGLPDRILPDSLSVAPAGSGEGFELVHQQFLDDSGSIRSWLKKMQGRPVQVLAGGKTHSGILVRSYSGGDPEAGLDGWMVQGPSGEAVLLNAPDRVDSLVFNELPPDSLIGPAFICQVRIASGGPASLRLSYLTEGLEWEARYAMTLEEGDRLASLEGYYTIRNETDVPYRSARTRLIRSEQGALGPLLGTGARGALRYSYGDEVPRFEQQMTGHAELERYELPRRLNLDPAVHQSIPFVRSDEVGLEQIYIYDGVRFDRFRRNRRNDWNYGTEYHTHVDAHLQFLNAGSEGLGMDLPAGRLNMFRQDDQGGMDLLGAGNLMSSVPDDELRVRIGPARGLHGERVRTGYSEIVPLHEYDESFEIRLENHSAEDVEITVVEHLYRWPDYRIIKADAEYDETGPQLVEFRVPVKAGGERTVHYTVRYRW